MSNRFEMAEALVTWARRRLKELAPYQFESFQKQSITLEFRIAIKEIFEHLRSALDYFAQEICERSSGAPLPGEINVYFPIVKKGFNPKDFRSRVGKLLPGVLEAREDLVPILASFQEFSSPEDNAWLPDFATLCNENKHEQLSFHRTMIFPGEISEHEGKPVYTIKRKDNSPMKKDFLMGFLPDPSAPGKGLLQYFRFDAINYEVNSFLTLAVEGVERILKTLKEKV